MNKIEELTEQQTHLMAEIAAEYEQNALSGDDSYDLELIQDGIDFIYKLSELKSPEIVLCTSPADMVEQAKLKKGDTFDYLGCGYDSGWTAFCDFFERIGVEFDKEWNFSTWKNFVLKSGVFGSLLFENVAFVCIRPCVVKRKEDGDLHCEDGPAIAWVDGYGEFSLNGVWMEEAHVMTPAEKLDPKIIVTERNVEVRRELIRKIGIERFIQASGAKVLDGPLVINEPYKTEYSLISVDLSEEVKGEKFLKMLNPSIGVWHVEGVPPSCRTVRDALHSRKPKKLRDIPVDETHGDDWLQQGDVVLWPHEAKSVKFFPAQLT